MKILTCAMMMVLSLSFAAAHADGVAAEESGGWLSAIGSAAYTAAGPFVKLGRGVGHVVLAPFDVPATMSRVSGETNALWGWTIGPAEGAVNCTMRALSGTAEVLTFAFPPYRVPIYDRKLGERCIRKRPE